MKHLKVLVLVASIAVVGHSREMQYPPVYDNPPAASAPASSGNGQLVRGLVLGAVIVALVSYVWHVHKRVKVHREEIRYHI